MTEQEKKIADLGLQIEFYKNEINKCNKVNIELTEQLHIGGVMHRSIEFAKYASTYYKVCYEKEPMWLNRNNHKRFTSSEVYENFINYANNGA